MSDASLRPARAARCRRRRKPARLRCPAVAEHGPIPRGVDGTRADAERQALRDLCDFADVLNLPDGAWLLAPVSPALLDVLAAFEADREDLEDDDPGAGDVNDEPQGESDDDDEPSLAATEAINHEHAWAAPDNATFGTPDLEEETRAPVKADRAQVPRRAGRVRI